MKPVVLFLSGLLACMIPTSPSNGNNVVTEGSVSGVVVDKQTRQPVEYANIVLYNQSDSSLVTGTVSAADGKYLIKNLKEGSYYLVAYFIGYKKAFVRDIVVNKSKRQLVLEPITIEQTAQQLNEVNVTADKNTVDYKIDKKVVNVAQNLSNAGGTAVDALKDVPGVTVSNEGNVSLRGSTSFTVLVDGKPTVLEGSEALKQIPASSVDKIEVITNPSARYDAEGTSGIINILMKKGGNVGFNGVVNASAGSRDKYSGDFLVNFKRKKINYFCGFNARSFRNLNYTDTYKESTVLTDTTSYLDSRATRDNTYRSYMGKGGFDYDLSSRDLVSFSGQVGRVDFDGYTDTRYHQWYNPENIPQYVLNNEHMEVSGDYYFATLNHQHKFKKEGHTLNTMVMYSLWNGDRNEGNRQNFTSEDWHNLINTPEQDQRYRGEDKTEYRIKADYNLPLDSSNSIEAGYQSSFKYVNSDQSFFRTDTASAAWAEVPSLRDRIAFRNNIHALYATYRGKIGMFEYELGLRTECTDRVLDQKTLNKKYNYQKTDFFPSFSVSRQFSRDRQLQFSYSRRINRPNEQLLNPMPMYSDSYTSMFGNPELRPEFIDSYEMNYMKRLKSSYYALEAYFRQNDNTFNQMIHVDEKGNYYIDFGNIAHTYFFGADLSGNVDVWKWLSISPSISLFGYKYKSGNITYEVPDLPVSWNARANFTFKVNKSTRFQLTGFMMAPYYDVQGWQDYFFTLGVSARRDVVKGLTAVLTMGNPFGVYDYHAKNKDTNLYNTFHIWTEKNVVTFSLSYKINNYRPVRRNEEQPDLNLN